MSTAFTPACDVRPHDLVVVDETTPMYEARVVLLEDNSVTVVDTQGRAHRYLADDLLVVGQAERPNSETIG